YTSPSKHPADSNIRDIYHPLFDKYKVDVVFNSDNHNYQRTFPLKYNSSDSSNPIIANENQVTNNKENNNNEGVIYLVTGTAGRSLYELEGQAPYVVKQDDKHYGFINIKINDKILEMDFHANANVVRGKFNYYSINYQNNLIDQFTLSKIKTAINDFDKF
ncbi:MAG TPA: hypothetical protein VFK40_13655, partial [Nitrososphaeraceae archaeon]|nr:hypothetical protein [Nitrososphaeraceae archaeon]